MPAEALRHLAVARCVLEADSPLSIGSGKADLEHDVVLVRDAHGLPALPGSGLTGVLRTEFARRRGDPAADELFGMPPAGGGDAATGSRSRIRVSWGAVHGEDDRPIDGPVGTDIPKKSDPIVRALLSAQPVKRDHVRTNELGVVDGAGKFDRGAVPAGARFTVQIEIEGDSDGRALDDILDILASGIRVGGATRRGYGALRLARCASAVLDLAKGEPSDPPASDALQALRALRRGFAEPVPDVLESRELGEKAERSDRSAEMILGLRAQDYWVVGSGEEAIGAGKNDPKPPDILPYTEAVIRWTEEGRGQIAQRVVLPGSSIKGALRHRTTFHLRRLMPADAPDEEVEALLEQLFGSARDDGRTDGSGRAGALFVRDVSIDVPQGDKETARLMHNGIDRFTGGVRKGVLFSEEVLYRTPLTVRCEVCPADQPAVVRRAFRASLRDLAEGRLAIGSGASRGHGYLEYVEGSGWPADYDRAGHWLSPEGGANG